MKLLISRGKYGDDIYEYDSQEQKEKAVFHILEVRLNAGDFQDWDGSREKAIIALSERNFQNALDLIIERADEGYEYEDISFTSTINI